jgi:hypothetical protein
MNPVHILVKITRNQTSARITKEINWKLLEATPLRSIEKFESISEYLDLYEAAGIAYIPLHYPIDNGVKCSCKNLHCQSIGKHPAIKSIKRLNFDDPATYRRMRTYWQKDERLNIGLLTDSFSVLDVDYRNNGRYSLGLLTEVFGEFSDSLSVSTGDGFHIYLSNIMQCSTQFYGLPGLDIRGMAGYIVAPPSLHKSQKAYRWLSLGKPGTLSLDPLLAVNEKNITDIRIQRQPVAYRRFNYGEREYHLFRVACGWRNGGCDYFSILQRLIVANQSRTTDPLALSELEHIAKSAVKYPTQAQKDMGLAP